MIVSEDVLLEEPRTRQAELVAQQKEAYEKLLRHRAGNDLGAARAQVSE